MGKYKCLVKKNTVDEDGYIIKDCSRQESCCEFCDYEECHEVCLNANNHNCSETCEFCSVIKLTLSEVLNADNNNKEFMCLTNQCIVKNVEGTLYYAEITGFKSNPKKGNTVILERTFKNDKFKPACVSLFWVNAEYEVL